MSPIPAGLPPRPVSPKSRLLSVACVLLAASAIVAGCGRSPAPSTSAAVEKPGVTVAVVPATAVAGLYIPQQRGYFTAAGSVNLTV